ncbi:PREDICTED: uncharacterized protein LOC108362393 [Rhagoletis zephyria]|uniref:uncharacterized protein LOC108362393 n=1 Tax=Rhagoletis zephyria TaxID=28612 RepID=UPI0008113B22|nr:PREDICTED: uncharacterized protein LOC108362393 [Rhagoletis zephyria]
MTSTCYSCTVLLVLLVTMAYAAPPLQQKHRIANTSQKRLKRQVFSNDFDMIDNPFFTPADDDFEPNTFTRPQWGRRPAPGQPLIFSNDGQQKSGTTTQTTPPSTTTTTTTQLSSSVANSNVVFVNNQPVIATMEPFIAATTASPAFLRCFGSCPTTSEYNPICASNRQQYQNPQKFDCARRCGADIQIVRRGACQGLFPMQRG